MSSIPHEKRQEILNLYAQGYQQIDIVRAAKVSKSTVYRVINGLTGQANGPDVVTKYVPDYRRAINPLKVQSSFTYGGVNFTVNYDEKTIRVDSLEDIEVMYDSNNIEDLKTFGEALVGIACTFDTLIVRERKDTSNFGGLRR